MPDTLPVGDHPVEDRSPKSVMSNGVGEAGQVDSMADRESSKELEQEQAHQTDQSVDTTVTSNGEPDESNSGKIVKSDTKAEETSKKRVRKPKSVSNSTDAPDSSQVDSDKEAEKTVHREISLSKEVSSPPSGEPSVEVAMSLENEKENIQMSSPKEIRTEAMDVASPSSVGMFLLRALQKRMGEKRRMLLHLPMFLRRHLMVPVFRKESHRDVLVKSLLLVVLLRRGLQLWPINPRVKGGLLVIRRTNH